MTTIAQVTEKIQRLMGAVADQLGQATGFIQRSRRISGGTFAQTLVFGWMGNASASLKEMSQLAACNHLTISRQGLDQRFTERAAHFMQALLEATIAEVVQGPRVRTKLLADLSGVYVLDSTCIRLPAALHEHWPGCGGSAGESACLKVSVLWELVQGGLEALELLPGKTHDQQARAAQQRLPNHSLRLADLGYYKLKTLASMSRHGQYWISSYKLGTGLLVDDRRIEVLAYLEAGGQAQFSGPVLVGLRQQLPARLVAVRVSDATLARRHADLADWERKKQCRARAETWALLAWDIYLTNLPATLFSAEAVLALAHYRWQIELLFKLWKSEGRLAAWRTQNPWRILCEIYAKLIALIFHHWFMLLGAWHRLDRSPTQALHTSRHFAWQLARALASRRRFCAVLADLVRCLQVCHMEKHQASPRSFQRLEALS
jgi:hypothetical protein